MSTETAWSEYRLSPGRHGLPREEVDANHRYRLAGAAAELFLEQGYVRITTSAIARRAAVSPATLYRHFSDLDHCLLGAHEAAAACLLDAVKTACREAQPGSDQKARAAIEAGVEFFVHEPALGNLLGAEAGAVPGIAEARSRLVVGLVGLARGEADAARINTSGPPRAEEHLVAAALALACERVARGELDRLPQLCSELTQLLPAPVFCP